MAFLAGATLVGTIGVGKAAVDASYSRVIPAKRKDTTLDESIRFVGTFVGLIVTVLHIPRAWEEAQKLIESAH